MTALDPVETWFADDSDKIVPLYHRWSYDPENDRVFIDERNKKEDNGYAIRIDGGWRLVDADSTPLKDLYVVKQVLDALKNETKENERPEDYDFDKLHYGQPLPVEIENE